tara:strand:+ start:1693 stop:2004 length:312 start_codon:yes stop_codon:yes gene_type:complete
MLDIDQEKIQKQVDRWDLFAQIAPTVFLIMSVILISLGLIDFNVAFYIGIGLFATTAVTWWFWTIYTIRHLVKTLNRATKNLAEVRNEFLEINKDIRNLRNDT